MDLAKIIPHIGDRAAVRHYCKGASSEQNKESTRMHLFAKLREKMGIPSRKTSQEASKSDRSVSPPKAQPQKRKVEFGWINQGRSVWARFGGGTWSLKVDGSSDREALLQLGQNLYFPKGVSPQGKIEEFECDILDYKQMPFPAKMSVDDIFEGMHMGK